MKLYLWVEVLLPRFIRMKGKLHDYILKAERDDYLTEAKMKLYPNGVCVFCLHKNIINFKQFLFLYP